MPLPPDLVAQEWTPDRVQQELVRDGHPWPRWELVDGQLLCSHWEEEPAVSPSPRRLHQRAVRELLTLLHPYVAAHGVGEVLMAPLDVRLDAHTLVQPDVLVAAPDADGRPTSDAPVTALLLAVEVVSPTSGAADRVLKRALYPRLGVPEYWVVDCAARLLEITRPGDRRVELHADFLRWHPAGASEALVLDVRSYFDRVVGPPAAPPLTP